MAYMTNHPYKHGVENYCKFYLKSMVNNFVKFIINSPNMTDGIQFKRPYFTIVTSYIPYVKKPLKIKYSYVIYIHRILFLYASL